MTATMIIIICVWWVTRRRSVSFSLALFFECIADRDRLVAQKLVVHCLEGQI